ncbi:amino acid ABC transporter ATP-binding protein [Ameyamaea chiangmaiensis]|nr:amino acid ABC transporter ATP-binding protein [Ameyamaea chiangmaiensis]
MISVRDLRKSYGTFEVLRGLSFDVARGERIAILGPSGSGKSTLIRCFNRIEPHDSGTLHIDGTVVDARCDLARLRAEVGIVFQNYNLFPHLSAVENCMLAPRLVRGMTRHAARDGAMRRLAQVGIAEQAAKYPIQLSGGQQQRVAIARALCMDPRVVLFDEPTAALDPEAVAGVAAIIDALARDGITTLCVTHEMGFARRIADRIVFMDDGQIMEIAPPETFFTSAVTERARAFLARMV